MDIMENAKSAATQQGQQGQRLRLFLLVFITLLPIALASNVWLGVLRGGRVRASDGSGHFALTQIYDQTIFPDTFGWTQAYFAGMPFPNFYPPLFQWTVSLLHHSGLFSFDAAFKLMVALPLWLLPVAIWLLARSLSGKNETVALIAAFGSHLLLLVPQMQPLFFGLSYLSTLAIGLYTQPLGFVLMIIWYVVYRTAQQRYWQIVLAGILLALTVLANFFSAITAAELVLVTLACDVWNYFRASDGDAEGGVRRAVWAHAVSPLIAAGLAAFWLVPMVTEYSYLVTRPITVSLGQYISPALWCWYALAAFGMVCWLRRPVHAMGPFVLSILALVFSVIFAQTVAPRWFPFQSYRFLATLNFLLTVPAGYGVWGMLQGLAGVRKKKTRVDAVKVPPAPAKSKFTRLVIMASLLLLLIGAVGLTKPSPFVLAFYSAESNDRIDGVLRFAAQHRDGRYLVEVPPANDPADWYDSFALNSYLGVQGNQTLSVIFRESSPNVLFFNPQVNAFSAHKDSFGLSSVLADDLDFDGQALARHLERVRMMGTRYLVIASPAMKERLAQMPQIKTRSDFGLWSVFELRDEPPPPVRVLPFKPALVVSEFSFKERRRQAYDFVRLAEEQFASGWFDVLLARAPELKLDRLPPLENFGALILDEYRCDDEAQAIARLREFAREHTILLLSRDVPLFHRLRQALAEFRKMHVIDRATQAADDWLEVYEPGQHYQDSAIRQEWEIMRGVLDQEKIATASTISVRGQVEQKTIQVALDRPSENAALPLLISTTYFPGWRRADGEVIYPATPFFMLTFARQSVSLIFARHWLDWAGAGVTVGTLILLCVVLLWRYHLARQLTQS